MLRMRAHAAPLEKAETMKAAQQALHIAYAAERLAAALVVYEALSY